MKKLFLEIFEFFLGSRNLEPTYKEKIYCNTLKSGDKVYTCFFEYKIHKFSIGYINCFEWGTLTLYKVGTGYQYYDLGYRRTPHEFESYYDAKRSLEFAISSWLKKVNDELNARVVKVEEIKQN